VIGIGSRNSEFGAAIGFNPGLTHALGAGVSTTLDTSFEDRSMHPWASIGVVMLLQSNLLNGFDDLCLLGLGGRVNMAGELVNATRRLLK